MINDYKRIVRHAKADYPEIMQALNIRLEPDEDSVLVYYPSHLYRCGCERELFGMLELARYALNLPHE
jgi:hypothetical protein